MVRNSGKVAYARILIQVDGRFQIYLSNIPFNWGL